MKKIRVLLTGASGVIGSAFWNTPHPALELRLADIRTEKLAAAPFEVLALDVSDYDACLAACRDIDVVLHLAGDPSAEADFYASLLSTNIIGTYNIFKAAQARGCARVVFASSAQAIEGYAPDLQVSEDMAPRPKSMYGVSKVFGEGVASCFAHQFGMTALAVRIANVAVFEAGQSHSPRDVAAFISVRDVVHLLARCVEADVRGFHIVHGVSDNRYKRLAIDTTRALVQYAPQDDAFDLLAIPGGVSI